MNNVHYPCENGLFRDFSKDKQVIFDWELEGLIQGCPGCLCYVGLQSANPKVIVVLASIYVIIPPNTNDNINQIEFCF